MSWKRHLIVLLCTFIGVNAALFLFILAMNPYGNFPGLVLREHKIMDTNQRFQYPWIVRSGRYDSIITGTSTSRLFEPKAFEGLFGGKFANVAMDSGTAWEQSQIVDLFLRHAKTPKTLVIGLDYVWCWEPADTYKTTARGFPEWMFDDNPWNDLLYMYNIRTIEIAGRRFAAAISNKRPRIASDGYEVFTPPESAYDMAKVNVKLYGNGPREHPKPQVPPASPTASQRSAWRFPALDWLAKIVADKRWQKIVLLWPPVHVTAQPQPDSLEAVREGACRARVAAMAATNGVQVVDFRIPSEITRTDTNYWDPLHYRVGIAARVAEDLGKALGTGRDDPHGDWVLPRPAKATRAE